MSNPTAEQPLPPTSPLSAALDAPLGGPAQPDDGCVTVTVEVNGVAGFAKVRRDELQHACGAYGFGQSPGDWCPRCEANKLAAEDARTRIADREKLQPPPPATCKNCGFLGRVAGRRLCTKCNADRIAQWHKRNPESHARIRRDWRKKHPQAENAIRARRQEWILSGDVTKADLQEVYDASGGRCVYCGEIVKARFKPRYPRGFDHREPLAKGGRHTKTNLVVSCAKCNCAKGSRLPEAFTPGRVSR